nr:MAG TPA: hypothetical protein [Caudoviricetes sp.]
MAFLYPPNRGLPANFYINFPYARGLGSFSAKPLVRAF